MAFGFQTQTQIMLYLQWNETKPNILDQNVRVIYHLELILYLNKKNLNKQKPIYNIIIIPGYILPEPPLEKHSVF